MTAFLDTVLVLLLISGFALLGSSRLGACIKVGAIQGVLTGLLPMTMGGHILSWQIVGIGIVVIVLKGFIFPRLLLGALRESETRREIEPFIGFALSLLIGVMSLIASFWLGDKLNIRVDAISSLLVPVAFFLMMTGLFLIVARRTAMNQVLGYLVLENGIYVFGQAVVRELPALVELAVLMDLFVAVFVMGIAIYHINREFDHIDSDRLNTLKG